MENYNNPSFILLISKESKQWTINIILNVTYTIHRQILYLIVNKNKNWIKKYCFEKFLKFLQFQKKLISQKPSINIYTNLIWKIGDKMTKNCNLKYFWMNFIPHR